MALRVLHVITGLDTGGAETMLAQLVTRGDHDRFHHVVVSLTTVGSIGLELMRKGVEVSALGMGRRLPNPFRALALRRLIREMSLANRLWGAPRIHGELLKLGIEVAQSTVGALDSQGALYQSGIGQRDVRLTPLQDCLLSWASLV